MYATVSELLGACGITAREQEISHNGYSGARLSALVQDGHRYLLKRLRLEDDWIMRVTGDVTGREAEFASSPVVRQLPPHVRVPTLGAAHDAKGWALLMRDITALLLPDDGMMSIERADAILTAIAELHATFWNAPLGTGVAWLPAYTRLTVLSPVVGKQLIAEGHDFGVARGWELFDRLAEPGVVGLIHHLFENETRLAGLLATFPDTLLHGDLKFANMGQDGDVLWLFDWSDVMRGPVAIELGWFVAVNSSRLPWPLDLTIDRYAAHLRDALGPARFAEAMWPAQRALATISGLMLYGWGKALDAEAGRPDELRWWCEGTLAAGDVLDL